MLDKSMKADIHLTLSEPEHAAAREALTLLCMYTSYLISTHDNEFRRAFTLLASAERLFHVVDDEGNVSYANYTYPMAESERSSRGYDRYSSSTGNSSGSNKSGGSGSRRARDAQLTEEHYSSGSSSGGSGGRGRRGNGDVLSDEERFVRYMRKHEEDELDSDPYYSK